VSQSRHKRRQEDDRPFPVGRMIDLRLREEGLPRPIDVKAIVRRVQSQIGMAVEFVALTTETKVLLAGFIEKNRAPRAHPLTAQS